MEPVTYEIQELEPILKDTEGIIIYQEQIMQIAQRICGYTLGEADNLRRIIGRKKVEEMEPVIADMIERGVNSGYSTEQMKHLTDNIVTFALYGFNRGHSAAYGMTAWVTAWLKVHYPCEFMASLIDSNCKDHEKLRKYVSESLELGIRIVPPQLRHKNCYSDYDENGPYIILGMNCIKGVGNTEIPKDAPTDFLGFMEAHGNLNKTVLSNLVKAGVFDGNRLKMLQYIVWYKDKRKSKGEFKYTENPYNKASMEASVMGITVANDIFDGYDTSMVNNFNTFILQIVSVKKTKTKKGKDMAFVKVRDNREIRDLVIFNDTFKNLQKDNVYIVKTRGTQILDFMEAKIV